MEDKEVGELWRELQLHSGRTNNLFIIEKLICKLVEERRRHYDDVSLHYPGPLSSESLILACGDFGIDPDIYPKI